MDLGICITASRPIRAVELRDGAPGRLVLIPQDATMKTISRAPLPNMLEIEWEGDRYAAFSEDLESGCTPVSAGRGAAG